jgi:hypothetical protein
MRYRHIYIHPQHLYALIHKCLHTYSPNKGYIYMCVYIYTYTYIHTIHIKLHTSTKMMQTAYIHAHTAHAYMPDPNNASHTLHLASRVTCTTSPSAESTLTSSKFGISCTKVRMFLRICQQHICICICMYVCMYVCMYIYAYIHTYTHTHIHIL